MEIKMLYLNAGETIGGTDIEQIRDAFNRGYKRGYEKGYEKGKADELQVIRQAQADRDLYDWKREIRR